MPSKIIAAALAASLLTLVAASGQARTEGSVNAQDKPYDPENALYWCTHALDSVFKDAFVTGSSPSDLKLSAARGQTVGAQIVVRAGTVPARVSGIRSNGLRHEDRKGSIGPDAFEFAFIDHYPVAKNSTATPVTELLRKAPAEFPDPFSEARERVVPVETAQPIWVQFTTPSRAAAGTYTGSITLKVDDDALEVPVTLTVYDFALPRATRLLVTVWTNNGSLAKHQNVTEGSEAWWQLLGRVAAMMRQHHQNVILTPWSLIKASRDATGTVRLNFTSFDRWVRTFLAEGFQRIEISHVGGRETGQWEDKTFVAYDMPCEGPEPGQQKPIAIEEWLPLLQAHLTQQGWLDRSMLHVADEPIEVNLASWKELSGRVRKAAPELRRIDAVHVPDLSGALEVWVPQLNYLQSWLARFQEAQKRGVELWYYTAWVPQGRFPNRLMDYALIKTRMLHWLNYTSGTTGYLHWGWNFWDVPFDQFAPGDNFIVYPGTRSPRSGLRYEAMREGIEDYEYLKLLEDAIGDAARRLGAQGLDAKAFVRLFAEELAPSFEDYSRDPSLLYAVRDSIARSIEMLHRPVPIAALAVAHGGDVVIKGLAPRGAILSVRDSRVSAEDNGRFEIVAPHDKGPVTLTVEVGRSRIEVEAPVIWR